MKYKDPHASHKTHRNVLYALVIVLAIFHIVSFTLISLQVSRLNVKIDSEISDTDKELRSYTDNLIEAYDSLYQENFNEISLLLIEQEQDFKEEIDELRSNQDDFSSVVQDALRSVVTVSTGSSIGTGFIIDGEGYIVTNHHVIDGKEESVRVLTYDRDVLLAEYIGSDVTRDLAVLKVDGNFEELKLAESDELQVGNKVIAIGNPLGLSFTVTEGIISGLNRVGPNGLEEYVQTDVSLNPGNSGGPLINNNGEVVGINNFKIGGAEALGFALQSDSIVSSVNGITNETIIDA